MNRAILKVSPEWFTQMLKSAEKGATRRYDVIENGLPSDARVIEVRSIGTNYGSEIYIHIESSSFPETKEGDELPALESPVLQILYDEPQV